MVHSFDVAAVWCQDESPVIARVVVRSQPGSAVIACSRVQCSLIKAVNGVAIRCRKGEMHIAPGSVTSSEPEIGLYVTPITDVIWNLTVSSVRHKPSYSQRSQSSIIECQSCFKIINRYTNVIHSNLRCLSRISRFLFDMSSGLLRR
ncbi:hypothetical protein BJF92_15405 [Rhizobium rhizosphaerae]|uniref:Uncharacterized protein n=1 Tax=Xaviernesmea rhizosphaerae TaxID=1672749 RepID=A0A1Q9ALW0_9HYPH|nr:hypothetical protein BJF92_15405 [Xaviernesmea rhizosphaerae]